MHAGIMSGVKSPSHPSLEAVDLVPKSKSSDLELLEPTSFPLSQMPLTAETVDLVVESLMTFPEQS